MVFYGVRDLVLDFTLPKLLDKIYESGRKSVVVFESVERMEHFDSTLWTFASMAFLPHQCKNSKAEIPDILPVWLTDCIENPNKAEVLVLTDGRLVDDFQNFTRCVDLFDLNADGKDVQKRIDLYEKKGCQISIWHQNLKGSWERIR